MKVVDYQTKAMTIMFWSTNKRYELEELIKQAKNDNELNDAEKELAMEKIRHEVGDITFRKVMQIARM